ncbi:hypothetical protein [Paludibacterium paludis]|uniref:Uncharacterized protein n=1 Tax=Paludibacterium paludis TaxID=1225769 RepID=A0A918P3A3_9NEIS|nr:hypothetical protein [Paludibacterium paludis]GGY17685.1 hypothetical protein GCM10011289_21490 [Paludibacterium paludis]
MKRLIAAFLLSTIGLTHAMVNPANLRATLSAPATASAPVEQDDMAAQPVPIHRISSAPRAMKKRQDKHSDGRARNSAGKYDTPAHKRPHRYSLLISN